MEEEVASGRRSFAALIPETAYGNAVEAQFREAVTNRGRGGRGHRALPAGAPGEAVKRLSGVITGPRATADVLFIPRPPTGCPPSPPPSRGPASRPRRSGRSARRRGTSPPCSPCRPCRAGRFAAPDRGGFAGFSARYQARFGAIPPRVASLAYDAVMLSATLTRQFGTQRFAEPTLTSASGFAGLDGTFRFSPEGTSDRALAVYEIRNNAVSVVSPAPRVLGKPGLATVAPQ